jgi:HPr kinase/phosphorylase
VGTGYEFLGHHMEIRGVGIIDIENLFGIRAIRIQKRIEVEVRLVWWEEEPEYERLGIEDKFTKILGVELPVVTIPVSPGKNITVISEVIAMNHMLKVYGQHPAEKFSKKLTEEIDRKMKVRDYLESDIE